MTKKFLKNEQIKSILKRIITRILKYFQHLFEMFDFQKIINFHRIDFTIIKLNF